MKFLILGFLSFGFPSLSQAAKPLYSDRVLELWTVHGDRQGNIRIEKQKSGKYLLSLYTSEGPKFARTISQGDVKYITKKFKDLKEPKTVPKDCDRARVHIRMVASAGKPESKSSCFGVKTVSSSQFLKFTDLLLSGF